jgi:hypothetical protein
MEQFIKDFWALLAAMGGLVVWAVRVEGKTADNTREIGRLHELRKDDREAVADRLTTIENDIKTILRLMNRSSGGAG